MSGGRGGQEEVEGSRWDQLPRLLQELCEGGCGMFRLEVYKRTERRPAGEVSWWECVGCFTRNEAIAEGRYIGKTP